MTVPANMFARAVGAILVVTGRTQKAVEAISLMACVTASGVLTELVVEASKNVPVAVGEMVP